MDVPRAELDASAGRSWSHSEDEDTLSQRAERAAFERNRFGFRARGISDATSQQSDGQRTRYVGFRHSVGSSHDHEQEEKEEEEEEEEDDDDVRHSWTTEKEPVHGSATDLTSFRFRSEHVREEEDEVHEGDEDEDGDGDSDASFASLEWVTRQLRQLERRPDVPLLEDDGHDEIDASVREALSLLNGGEEEPRVDGGDETWARTAQGRRDSYLDIVQEAMGAAWHGREENEHHEEQGEHSEREQEEEEHEGEHQAPEEIADEWLEAFTAKGRVYYYNRRTRESSWTRPESLEHVYEVYPGQPNQQEHEVQSEEEEEEDEEHYEQDHGSKEQHGSDVAPQEQHAVEQLQNAMNPSDHRSARSSTSSTSSANDADERETTVPSKTDSLSDVLFCCFCGSQLSGSSGFQTHFDSCTTLLRHKQSASPLYTQFQQMLVLLSEDASLRSLHYASSFLDAKPHPLGVESPQQTRQSVRESLTLLRVKHRSSRKPLVHRAPEYDDIVPSFQPAPRLSLGSNTSSKKRSSNGPREPLATRYASMKQKPTPVAQLNMETCRHCGRSFAEGRLAKHEAVCPRVFGNEHAWGRGPSPSVQKASNAVDASTKQRQDQMLRSLKKKHHANLTNTLALSFQEHQASLVECPCCRRKFAPSGAQQHIDICKTVQHRPRNPVPLLKDYAIAS